LTGQLDTVVDANCLAVIKIPLGSLAEARIVEVLKVRHNVESRIRFRIPRMIRGGTASYTLPA
jgi:hypothetical protein